MYSGHARRGMQGEVKPETALTLVGRYANGSVVAEARVCGIHAGEG